MAKISRPRPDTVVGVMDLTRVRKASTSAPLERVAGRHGLAVPVNQKVVDTVHALARRELGPSRDLLDRLHEETRA